MNYDNLTVETKLGTVHFRLTGIVELDRSHPAA